MLKSLLLFALGLAGKVDVLTTESFESFIQDNERVLVEFYAPWCGHCKALEPEFDKAATTLGNTGSQTKLAKVDATVETDLAKQFEVQGFPTLKYFTGDPEKPQEYGGGRTQETIVSWINKRELPPVTHLTDATALGNLKTKEKLVFIAFCDESSTEAALVNEFATKNRDQVVVGRANPALAKAEGATVPSYVLHRDFAHDEPIVGHDFRTLGEFFRTNRFPVIDEIGPENYQLYMNRGLPMAWLSIASDDSTSRKAAESAAAAFKGQFSLVWVDSVKYKQHVESNIGIKSAPGLMIVTEENKKFLMKGKMDTANILKFFTDFANNASEEFRKTQEPPATNDNPIKVIVGKNFDKMIKENNEQGKFVEFYAPWCGHCKKLAPIWEELGAKYADDKRLLIAKIDATENDTPENIMGFPTLLYYNRNGEKEKFQGARELEDLTNFVDEKLAEMDDETAEGRPAHDEL